MTKPYSVTGEDTPKLHTGYITFFAHCHGCMSAKEIAEIAGAMAREALSSDIMEIANRNGYELFIDFPVKEEGSK